MANPFHLYQKLLSRIGLGKSNKENSNTKFAFIIHPRDVSDAARKYSFLKFFPKSLVKLICRLHPPLIGSKIVGLKSLNSGEPIDGWLLICPLTAKQLLNDRKLAIKRIKETISLAENLGVKMVGIGALIASVTSAGKDLVSNLKIGITHGRALTVGISLEGIKEIAKIKNINLEEITVGIVGAAGTIGEAIAKLLIEEKVKNFILVAKSKDFKYLTQLKEEMKKLNPLLSIEVSTSIHFIKKAELVIVATSSPEILIKSEDLKYGAVVYDVTQPQNISPEIIKERKDLLIIDGGIVKTPGINYHFNFGLPPETTFACLAETLILAAEKRYNSCLVGEVESENVKEIIEIAKKYNFTHAPFTSFGKPIFLENFKEF
jgi:predicted amino acid dehydrogenase